MVGFLVLSENTEPGVAARTPVGLDGFPEWGLWNFFLFTSPSVVSKNKLVCFLVVAINFSWV